jgi:hypothetical protein
MSSYRNEPPEPCFAVQKICIKTTVIRIYPGIDPINYQNISIPAQVAESIYMVPASVWQINGLEIQ